MSLSEKLSAVSSDLRRVSIFAASQNWKQRKEVIEGFLDNGRRLLWDVEETEETHSGSKFDWRRHEYEDLVNSWPFGFKSDKDRFVWCENALTLSLRLRHLADFLRK